MISHTWRCDWDLILQRQFNRLLKEPAMFDRFKFITSSVWRFLKPLIVIFLSAAGPVLAKSAAAAVRSVQKSASPSTAGYVKRESARDIILNDLRAAGIELAAGTAEVAVNAAIEAAVLGLKSESAQ